MLFIKKKNMALNGNPDDTNEQNTKIRQDVDVELDDLLDGEF